MSHLVFWMMCFGWASLICHAETQEIPLKSPTSYEVVIVDGKEKFRKKYPVVTLKSQSQIKIVYINFAEDSEIIFFIEKQMARKAPSDIDLVVIIGNKANILGAFVAKRLKTPWLVLGAKRSLTPIAEDIDYRSVTSGMKTMYISTEQQKMLRGKNIIIVDDVLSSGESMRATVTLCKHAGAHIKALMVGFTEGVQRSHLTVEDQTYSLISMGHLPIFPVD